jgi:hypothetical protein
LGLQLQTKGISPLLGYSKETSDSPDSFLKTENEVIRCIYAAKAFEKPAYVAIKLSGLASEKDLRELERAFDNVASQTQDASSKIPSDRSLRILHSFPELWDRLRRLSEAARKADVHLVLDAELRFRGDVDALPSSTMICSLLNEKGRCIWNTHQMYFVGKLFADKALQGFF